MDYLEAIEWLNARADLERTGTTETAPPRLDRIQALIELLGSPQLEFPAIHVTGTNGKSSTTKMIAALLEREGLSAGAYSSPHLHVLNERLQWRGNAIEDEEFAALLSHVKLVSDFLTEEPSTFELMTGAALKWFADVAVQVAVIEVGMGGTWDATNVVDADVAVITNVAVDHTEFLGHTRQEIAIEKAGIIKPGCTLVLGETDAEIAPFFLDQGAAEVVLRGAEFGVRENRPAHGGRMIDLYTPRATYSDILLTLHGAHQADNAAAALAAAEVFVGEPLDEESVAEVFGSMRMPGRLEIAGYRPVVILDAAHNPAGARALMAALAIEFPSAPRTLVVGLLREKDPVEMLSALEATKAARVICCQPASPRAMDPREVQEAAIAVGVAPENVSVAGSVEEAMARALQATPASDQILVTGSFSVVAPARVVMGKH